MWGLLEHRMYQHLSRDIPGRAQAALMDVRDHIAQEEFGSALTTIDTWTDTLTYCAQASMGIRRYHEAYQITSLVGKFQAEEKDLRSELRNRAVERDPESTTFGLGRSLRDVSLRDAILILVDPQHIVYHTIRLDEDGIVRSRERLYEMPTGDGLHGILQYTNIVSVVQDKRLDEVEIPVLCEWYRMHIQ